MAMPRESVSHTSSHTRFAIFLLMAPAQYEIGWMKEFAREGWGEREGMRRANAASANNNNEELMVDARGKVRMHW